MLKILRLLLYSILTLMPIIIHIPIGVPENRWFYLQPLLSSVEFWFLLMVVTVLLDLLQAVEEKLMLVRMDITIPMIRLIVLFASILSTVSIQSLQILMLK